MAKKPSLTIEQQVELLQKRNLNIPGDQIEELKKFLLNNNYYRISGYTLTLRQDDKFYPNASFDNIKQIYQFDKRLRHSILSLTEEIEVRVKSMLAYYHSQKYGPMGYKDVNTFHCAHGGRLYNRNFIRKPKLSGKQKQLLRVEEGKVVYDRLFSYILVIKDLSLPEDFELLKEHFLELTSKYPFVDMKYYGFPDNWKEIV